MIPILLAVASIYSTGSISSDSLKQPQSQYENMLVTRCIDGEVVSHDRDSTIIRLRSWKRDTLRGPGLLSVGYDFDLDGRRLVCVKSSRVGRLSDSTMLFVHPTSSIGRVVDQLGFPLFSIGASISFDASATGRGHLQEMIGASVDTSGSAVASVELLPSFDVSMFRVLGFRWSPGLGGEFYITGTGVNTKDKISVSYKESRWGPYFELPLRLFWKPGPPVSLRASYQWISGRLELPSVKLRQEFIDYSGSSDIYVDISGGCTVYSLVYGERFFAEANLFQKELRFDGRRIHKGVNIGVGVGMRI